jgi:hypothetical protein
MRTFHPFPYLPFELRARIWELTVEPRTVEVRTESSRGIQVLSSSTPVPAILHTCQQARNQRLYEKAFSGLLPYSESRYVWVNLDIDTISIGTTGFSCFKNEGHLIRRLKFERENSASYNGEYFYRTEVHDLALFMNVEEIYVVCVDGLIAWWGAVEEHWFPCGAENVFMIDPENGRMMAAIEMDEMFDREQAEALRLEELEDAVDESVEQTATLGS